MYRHRRAQQVQRAAVFSLGVAAGTVPAVPSEADAEAPVRRPAETRCPGEMVKVHGFCVDRWEVSLVDRKTRQPLSPYYPPSPALLRRVREVWEVERKNFGDAGARSMPLPDLPRVQRGDFAPLAVSRPGVVPQGYLSYPLAKLACENAGKRLCTEAEWVAACQGAKAKKYPYGADFSRGKCNVYRSTHPAQVLHGDPSLGHTDPRLNLIDEDGQVPLLALTGASPACASSWGQDAIWDMVGNVDEWIDDPGGVFVGGFYSRSTTEGCEARIASHAPTYYDYSLGARCCAEPR